MERQDIDKLLDEVAYRSNRENWYVRSSDWCLLLGRVRSYASLMEYKYKQILKRKWRMRALIKDREKVLILGNGKSRLEYSSFIDNWDGELWVCNRAYKDFSYANRLCGHKDILIEAYEDKFKGEIWGNIEGWGKREDEIPDWMYDFYEEVGLPFEFQSDAGTTLVACALHEGYKEIHVCGFDLGGADVYWEEHGWGNNWLNRWKKISKVYGLDRVYFISKDIRDFIFSLEEEDG